MNNDLSFNSLFINTFLTCNFDYLEKFHLNPRESLLNVSYFGNVISLR